MKSEKVQMKIALILMLGLSACAKDHPSKIEIDPRAQPYVNAFVIDGEKVGHTVFITDLTVEISDDIPSTLNGRCYRDTNKTPRVVLRRSQWDFLSEFEQKMLVYHELGHCLLNRTHNDAAIIVEIPIFSTVKTRTVYTSVMNHNASVMEYYYTDMHGEENYLHELFDNERGSGQLQTLPL